MLDLIKKSIYLGLGIATTTKEKVEGLVDGLIEKGILAKEEKSEVQKEILDKLEKSEKDFKEKVRAVVNETWNNLGYATQKDLKELKGIIFDLETRLDKSVKNSTEDFKGLGQG